MSKDIPEVDDNKHQQLEQPLAAEKSKATSSNFNKLNINKPGTEANAKKHTPKAKDDRPRPWRLRPLALARY